MHVQIDTSVIGNAAIVSIAVWSRCLCVSVYVCLASEVEEERVHGGLCTCIGLIAS